MGELIALSALMMFAVNILLTKVASRRVSIDTGFLVSVSVNVLFALGAFAIQSLLR